MGGNPKKEVCWNFHGIEEVFVHAKVNIDISPKWKCAILIWNAKKYWSAFPQEQWQPIQMQVTVLLGLSCFQTSTTCIHLRVFGCVISSWLWFWKIRIEKPLVIEQAVKDVFDCEVVIIR